MIYFDNSATTKPFKEVLQTFLQVADHYYGNPSSLHGFGGKVEQLVSQARKQIADLLNVKAKEIYFTSGGTESNNLAIKGTAMHYQSRGKHLITTSIEHASVLATCEQLREHGFKVTYVPVNKEGQINVDDVMAAITEETILVSLMHVNNEIGTIQPIKEVGCMLQKYPKILFHVDHVQGCGKIPLDFQEADIDLCSISAHKFHGLKGNGILYMREGLRLSPLLSGGSQESNVRSGTENTAGIVAMAKALRMIEEKRQTKMSILMEIRDYLWNTLQEIPNLQMHTPFSHAAPHILNFSLPGFRGEVIVHALEEKGIFISTTSACSSKQKIASGTLKAMGLPNDDVLGAVRVSLSYENTVEEAKIFVASLREVIAELEKTMRRSK